MSDLPEIEVGQDEGRADPFVFDETSASVKALLKAGVPRERLKQISDDYAADAAEDTPAARAPVVEKR